jgi:hypothetical protein
MRIGVGANQRLDLGCIAGDLAHMSARIEKLATTCSGRAVSARSGKASRAARRRWRG